MAEVQRDRYLLTAAGFLRATATSAVGITLGLHLSRLGITGRAFGAILSAGLAGAALAAVAATFLADRVGPRRFLLALTSNSVLATVAFAFSSHPLALGVAAFFATLNAMGRDRGAALVIEQAALPATTTDAGRTRTIAVYTMLQDLGHALGAALVGLAASTAQTAADVTPHRTTFLVSAAASILALAIYARLSPAFDAPAGGPGRLARLSPASRRTITRLSALFAVDGLAGGFLTTAMLSFFFFERFGASEGTIGLLFFAARLMNAASHLGAAWLAKRIGLVNTMVFTHIPSSLLLATVAIAPNFPIAAVLFLLREGLVEMDVPTRQSYVFAIVRPEERTIAAGVTNLIRLAAWAVAPAFAGILMATASLVLPLVIGSAMKIAYDLLLWRAFRGLRPPEEVANGV